MLNHRWKLKKKESEAASVNDELNKSTTTNDKGLEMYEQELYDDASSVMASSDEVTINLPGPLNCNYSQVNLPRPLNYNHSQLNIP